MKSIARLYGRAPGVPAQGDRRAAEEPEAARLQRLFLGLVPGRARIVRGRFGVVSEVARVQPPSMMTAAMEPTFRAVAVAVEADPVAMFEADQQRAALEARLSRWRTPILD